MTISSGLLIYRKGPEFQFLLVHPGGPFFKNKDEGWWTIPKGQVEKFESALTTAIREVKEEINLDLSGLDKEKFVSLGSVMQTSKKVICYAIEMTADLNWEFKSTEITHKFKDGSTSKFAEIDRAEFFSLEEAKAKINKAQVEFLEKLISLL
jgi:predicted NUDIX family NTP pyrophosphohydrolase